MSGGCLRLLAVPLPATALALVPSLVSGSPLLAGAVYLSILLHELAHVLGAGGCGALRGVSLLPPGVELDRCTAKAAKLPAAVGLAALPFLLLAEDLPARAAAGIFALNLLAVLEECPG